jgi:hypothetical protein
MIMSMGGWGQGAKEAGMVIRARTAEEGGVGLRERRQERCRAPCAAQELDRGL